jgi:uncharacterized integral membrane protein
MRLFGRRLDAAEIQEWQPRLWARLIALVVIVAYAIAFVVENHKKVHLHFVLATATVSLIWLILLSLGIGVLGGVLLSQLYRRRRRLER